ncbi:hypothetical protein [Paenibacillus sp. 1P07SE]|uniref:hypothetical protein n=1 Tax=Paenibacillus sp. 1P07SE TaxID=3132209 RepID=UPI0039A5B0AF
MNKPPNDTTPSFSRFDNETREEKEKAYLNFEASQRIRDRREERLRPFMKAGKLLLAAASLLLIIWAITSAIWAIPLRVSQEYPAVMLRMEDPSVVEPTKIRIEGQWKRRLFADPRFEGSMVIDSFEHTATTELADLTFITDAHNNKFGYLTYVDFEIGTLDVQTLGLIWQVNRMEEVAIWVFEPLTGDRKSTKDLMIAGPAESREEAVAIIERHTRYGEP